MPFNNKRNDFWPVKMCQLSPKASVAVLEQVQKENQGGQVHPANGLNCVQEAIPDNEG